MALHGQRYWTTGIQGPSISFLMWCRRGRPGSLVQNPKTVDPMRSCWSNEAIPVQCQLQRRAGLLLGGDWLPWEKDSLQPAWWQSVFVIDNRRVWASLCVEQVQPWTWLEAMAQRPNLILAMTNDWWAKSMTAPGIQMANTRSWARLISGRMSEIGEQETLAIINQNELRAFRTIGVYDMHKFDEEICINLTRSLIHHSRGRADQRRTP